jgi:hypothetical protein
MAVGTAKQKPFPVEFEGTVLDPFRVPNPEGLCGCILSARRRYFDVALIEGWILRAP